MVRDFRGILGKSRPAHCRTGRPSPRTIIAAKDASILAHFRRPAIEMEMDPKIGYHYPRLGPRQRDPLIPNAWSVASWRSRRTRYKSGRPSLWALIAASDAIGKKREEAPRPCAPRTGRGGPVMGAYAKGGAIPIYPHRKMRYARMVVLRLRGGIFVSGAF